MKEPTTNRFYKGIQSDITPLESKGDTYLDAVNARLLKRPEGGYVLSSKDGNERVIEITPGFQVVSFVQYRRLLFMLTHNPTSNESQIGSYPSPNYAAGSGFVDAYSPLQNFTTQSPLEYLDDLCENNTPSIILPFQTSSLGLSLEHRPRLKVRGESDGSANLYYTDGNQPIRVFNSGFNVDDGTSNGKYTSLKSIESGFNNLSYESEYHPIYELQGVSAGGSLKHGNYFVTLRYVDELGGSSSFLSFSAPISIGTTITGNVEVGDEVQALSNKSMRLIISNLDPNASFVEIGYVYAFDTNSFEENIISGRFTLDGSGSLVVTITGNEDVLVSSIDEIISLKPSDSTLAKDIETLNNYLYLYNTKGVAVDHPDLRKLACAITVEPTYRANGQAQRIVNSGSEIRYIDPVEIFDEVGYFSGETYAFCLFPVLKGGFYGLPIPMRGADYYSGTLTNPNNKGYVRFPNAQLQPFTDGLETFIKGIRVNGSLGASIYNTSDWLKENLVGFYVGRAERKENMLYQGMLMHCYDGNISPYQMEAAKPTNPPPVGFNYKVEADWRTQRRFMPFVESQAYGFISIVNPLSIGQVDTLGRFYYAGKDEGIVAGKMGLVGIDYFLNQNEVDGGYLQRYARTTNKVADNNLASTNAISFFNGSGSFFSQRMGYSYISYEPFSLTGFTAKTANVGQWQAIPSGSGFVSRFEDGRDAQDDGLWFHWHRDAILEPNGNKEFNLPMSCPSYIGIENAPINGGAVSAVWGNSICALWRINPSEIDYANVYDQRNERYFTIGNFVPIDTFLTTDTERFQGDCFVARQYIAITQGHVDSFSSENLQLITDADETWELSASEEPLLPSTALPKGYGHWVSFVVETKYNQNYRYALGRNRFYPEVGFNDAGKDFAWLLDAPESNFYNRGYNRMLPPRSLNGIDPQRPTDEGHFITRLRVSNRHVTGALLDGYRSFDAGDFFDGDYSLGNGVAILAVREQLFSIQEHAINLHPINERDVSEGTQGTTFVSGGFNPLPSYRNLISDQLGSQHQFAVCKGKNGLYGFDASMRTWWRVAGNQPEDLALKRMSTSWLHSQIGIEKSNLLYEKQDLTLLGEGFSMDFNENYKEVLLTVHHKEQTLVFNEALDVFVGRWSYAPKLWMPLGLDFYATNGSSALYEEDNSNNPQLNYFGNAHVMRFRVVAAPKPEGVKHWQNAIISCNNRTLKSIAWETQHQLAVQDPFVPVSEFWYNPVYREHQWDVPIRRADSLKEPNLSYYEVNSPMRGRYLYIEVAYEEDAPFWVREVITFYLLSKL